MSFKIGDKLGDYEIIGILGAGGMGRVYKVRNQISDRVDAMKVLLPDLANAPELADRFLREIKVLASLNHPNIAGLRTAFRLENQLLMIMEYVEGTTLEEKLKDGPFPVPDAVDYACQVLSALGYAHAQGVIHRDIKPANIMLTPQNAVKLMDFGIAKSSTDRKLTMTGTTMGSLYYMPPEQVQGLALDLRSDLYSLGVTLYEMVTGSRPFKGQSDYDLMVSHLQKIPAPPIEIQPELPKALNDIIMTALEKDPAQRFQSAEAFRFALQSVHAAVKSLPVAPAPAVEPDLGGQAAGSGAAPSATAVLGATSGQPSQAQPQPTTPYPTPAAPPVAPAVIPPPTTSRNNRAVFVILGALAVIALLAVGAMQFSRLMKARARASQVAPPAEAAAESPATPPQPASTQNANDASASSQLPAASTDQQSAAGSAQPSAPSPANSTAGAVPSSRVATPKKSKAPSHVEAASDAANNTALPASPPQNEAPATTGGPPAKLWLDPAARLFIVVSSINIKPDGSFKFHGKLLLPVPQPGPIPLDRGTEVIGAGLMSGGQTSLAVTEILAGGARYKLKGGSGAVKAETPGGGGGVHLNRNQLLDMWPTATAAYEKVSDQSAQP